MDRPHLIAQLERHASVFRHLLKDLSAEEARWRPAPEKWCPLEIICHLYDEEREDFRARLRSTLEDPEVPWPKIDPAAWVSGRRYMEKELATTLEGFLAERGASLSWLRGLDEAPWTNAYIHPKVGPVSCELLLTNWVAHDLHHIRQLINGRYAHLKAHTTVPLDYAGTW
ncbi:MAG TPA: DinB family protein [Flavobacteriales bacterium]|nr:DinB family protein [Flavobacteriales bacterium]HMR27411.1 DinB family protein [Flavobacteriales bacterium]